MIKPDQAMIRSTIIVEKALHGAHAHADHNLLLNPNNSDIKDISKGSINEESDHYSHLDISAHHHKENNAAPYLLLVALCMDGFFEGIAIGVQGGWHLILFVTICVMINKWNIALGLGTALRKADTDSKQFLRLIILFSLFTPIGVACGLIASVFNQLVQAIFLAISAGSFIYSCTSVVIVEEFTITKYKYSKYFTFVFGGLIAAGIAFYEFRNNKD